MTRILGLDLSISCTGVAGNGWATTIPTKPYSKRKASDPAVEEQRRLDRHHERLAHILNTLTDQYLTGVDLVVMEGLAFNSHDVDRQNAGLAWIIRHHLHRLRIPYALVPPACLKTYATGKGGGKDADKTAVLAAVDTWFPGLTADDNAADATVLAAMGYEHLGCPIVTVPDRNRSALTKCFWPELPADDHANLPVTLAA